MGYAVQNMMLSSLSRAIQKVGHSSFYEDYAEYMRCLLKFDNVIAIRFAGISRPEVLYKKTFGADVFRYLRERYLPDAYLLDPIYHLHLNRKEAGLYRLLDVAPDQFRRSRYFKFYYGRIGIIDEISVLLPVGSDTTLTVSMGRDRASGGRFPMRDEDRLRQHEPVIMALLSSHCTASEVQSPSMVQASAVAHSASVIAKLIVALRERHSVSLSPRQAEVALFILQGHSTISIALNMHVSPQTVKVFRKQIYRRCSISSQAELFALLLPIL